ncbi:MAG TPA: hypothetical protein VM432_06900 [Bdellovibrionales bacterium]|nr:hypothetical protein [Bdellovibrionales bacterium]
MLDLRSDSLTEYRTHLNRIADLATGAGRNVRAFNPGITRFEIMSSKRKQAVLQAVASYRRILESASIEGISTDLGGPTLTWWALRSLKLVPPSDLLSRISLGDAVEIFDEQHNLLFRSLNAFGASAATIDEVFSNENPTLEEREGTWLLARLYHPVGKLAGYIRTSR